MYSREVERRLQSSERRTERRKRVETPDSLLRVALEREGEGFESMRLRGGLATKNNSGGEITPGGGITPGREDRVTSFVE